MVSLWTARNLLLNGTCLLEPTVMLNLLLVGTCLFEPTVIVNLLLYGEQRHYASIEPVVHLV